LEHSLSSFDWKEAITIIKSKKLPVFKPGKDLREGVMKTGKKKKK